MTNPLTWVKQKLYIKSLETLGTAVSLEFVSIPYHTEIIGARLGPFLEGKGKVTIYFDKEENGTHGSVEVDVSKYGFWELLKMYVERRRG